MPVVTLSSRLDLDAADALKTELLAALSAEAPVTLDGGAVESVDTACLQLLTAFTRELSVLARPARWTAVSPALSGTAQRLGLSKLLALEVSSTR